jgi:hypothetical protein
LHNQLSIGNSSFIQVTKGSWQTVSITGTMDADSSNNSWRIGTWLDASNNLVDAVGEKIYIRNYQLEVKNAGARVVTWYDQSANSNHATQDGGGCFAC